MFDSSLRHQNTTNSLGFRQKVGANWALRKSSVTQPPLNATLKRNTKKPAIAGFFLLHLAGARALDAGLTMLAQGMALLYRAYASEHST